MPEPVFEWYKDMGGKYRFRLKAANGEIIFAGGPYQSKLDLSNAIEEFKKSISKAENRDFTLNEVGKNVKDIKDTLVKQETHANLSFYIGVILGGLLGVIGNFFASFWFQNPQDIIGLVASGILLIVVFCILLYQAKKYSVHIS